MSWLLGFRKRNKESKGLEASLVFDTPHVKMAQASFYGKPWFIAVGLSEESNRELSAKGVLGPESGLRGKYADGQKMKWRIYENRSNIPGYVSEETSRAVIAGTLSMTSGGVAFTLIPAPINTDDHAIRRLSEQIDGYVRGTCKRRKRSD